MGGMREDIFLSFGPRIYSCSNCRCNIAHHDDVISKAFQGRNGRAYLLANVVNVKVGAKEERQLVTGYHIVAKISCFQCKEVLGWKYEKAYEASQKYKEGKYILEKAKVMEDG
ncbi:hypothetical protein O6H91_16G083000 [Diphasiastrum complanatum]|uniref:Uncharacterized protein n=1 Tax=Diphasiastrum complanatum TaxID=34168 RepID=A0ACC2BEE9_DIPCM|nr:hypothetical protein O6H91_16G083000 [Diphasiastrum complanatum]